MFTGDLKIKAKKLIDRCGERGIRITTAESCTGGLIAGLLTEIPGAAEAVDCGFITYCNEAKEQFLGVPHALIEQHGAVSEPVARAMADGAIAKKENVNLAVAVTGIAGPGGGSKEKPVGTVHLAVAMTGKPTMHRKQFFKGNRSAVRVRTVREALRMMLEIVADEPQVKAESNRKQDARQNHGNVEDGKA